MSSFPRGLVLTSRFLAANGFNNRLVSCYKHSHWLDSLGDGAYRRRGEGVDWKGALAALQIQLQLHLFLNLVANQYYLNLFRLWQQEEYSQIYLSH